jgi:hypothetical protein
VFAAFDRGWSLVGLTLALAAIVIWIALISHATTKLL